MPQYTGTYPQNAKSVNVVGANAGLLVKTGSGTLLNFSVNTAGTSSTLVVYDSTSTATGTKLGNVLDHGPGELRLAELAVHDRPVPRGDRHGRRHHGGVRLIGRRA